MIKNKRENNLNMKKIFVFGIMLILASFMVFAQTHEDFTEAKQLINDNVSCDNLSDAQLEQLGDYYMEQIHPGDAHERMDAMMGGEGSESLRLIHVNMGKRFYCGESTSTGMMGGSGFGMMSGGLTGSCGLSSCPFDSDSKYGGKNMMGDYGSYGMMGGLGFFGMGLIWLLYMAIGTFIFGLIFWWTKKLVAGDKHKKHHENNHEKNK